MRGDTSPYLLGQPNSTTGYTWFWGINWFERPKSSAHLPGWDGFARSRQAAMEAPDGLQRLCVRGRGHDLPWTLEPPASMLFYNRRRGD